MLAPLVSSSEEAKPPTIPEAEHIYTGYSDTHASTGPALTTRYFYTDPKMLLKDLKKSKFLGCKPRLPEYLSKGHVDDRFHQGWTITINKTHFMSVRLFGHASSKELYCQVRYWDTLGDKGDSLQGRSFLYKMPDWGQKNTNK